MSLASSFQPRGFKLRGHTINEFKFISAWQSASSIREVKQKLGLETVENHLLSQLAGKLRRNNGIPLKKFAGSVKYTDSDLAVLSAYTEWVTRKLDNGMSEENLTFELFLSDTQG